MITFEATEDAEQIQAVLAHPECYRRMANDAAPPREHFVDLARQEPAYFSSILPRTILAKVDGESAAIFLICPREHRTVELHFCFMPRCWGRTQEIGAAFLEWCWRDDPHLKVIEGWVPSYNRLAYRLARRLGFKRGAAGSPAGTKRAASFYHIQVYLRRPKEPHSNDNPLPQLPA